MKAKTTWHRLLSTLLCIVMVMGLLPMTAFAEGGGTVTEVSTYEELYTAVTRGNADIKLMGDIFYRCPNDKAFAAVSLNFKGTQTLDLNNHSLEFWTLGNHQYHTTLFSFINIATDCNVTIKNGSIKQVNYKVSDSETDKNLSGGPVKVSDNGKLFLQNVNVENGVAGKGIDIRGSANVSIYGGVVQSSNGYAVYMSDSSKLTLDGGVELRTKNGHGVIPVGAYYAKAAAGLYFLRKGVKLHFCSLGTIFEENMRGVQRGEIPWLWVSNRGKKHPCWHTIFLGKSSVLYLLRPVTLERGCPHARQTFPAAAEQADFVGCKLQKTRNLQ